MDYAAFRSFRDQVVRDREVLRTDCMNPAQALARWQHAPADTTRADVDPARALAAWTGATGLRLDPAALVAGTGVRDLLGAIFDAVGPRELWLPGDVYPVYWQLAPAARPFTTLPAPCLQFLARTGERAVVVVPVPLTPLGRGLRPEEWTALQTWLATGRDRLLVVDAVYTYDFAASQAMVDMLLATDRCVLLWSCTKSWLCSNALGVAAAPSGLAAALRARVRPGAALGHAVVSLEQQPDLPACQQAAFTREWARLAPRLGAADPTWTAPDTGYFAVLRRDHRSLLDAHGILAVPASVFGSSRPDLSIVTCLHDLVLHA